MRDPRQGYVRHGFKVGFLLQIAKEIFFRLKVLLSPGPLFLCRIHFGALLVFGGKSEPFEGSAISYGTGIFQRVPGQIDDRNLRKRGAHLLALKGIVVKEGERIDADVQLLRDFTQILRLVCPINTHGREVLCPHQHPRMLFDRFHGVVEIILAAHGEQNSLARQVEQCALQDLISRARIFRANLNAGHAVFADDAAPQRVVEIDGQNFCGAAAQRHDKAHPLARHLKKITGGDGKPRRQPFALVVPMFAAMARHQRVVIQDVHSVESFADAPQFTIDLADQSRLSGLGLVVEHTQTWS